MKTKVIIPIILILAILTGCGKNVPVIAVSDSTVINTDDYTGEMCYEVVESYVTTDLAAHNVAIENIDQFMFVYATNSDGEIEYIDYPDFIDENGQLTGGCSMYIVKLRVTNTNAEYKDEKLFDYGSPYIFRADNISLNYISEDQKTIIPLTISYYSLRQDDDSVWCTFQLKPGESIEYEIGFILGPIVYDSSSQESFDVNSERLFLSGGEAGYYQISWEER